MTQKLLIPCKGFSIGGATPPTYYATLEYPDTILVGSGQTNTFKFYCDPSNTGASSSTVNVGIELPDGGEEVLFQGVSPSTTAKTKTISFSDSLWNSSTSSNKLRFLVYAVSNSANTLVTKEVYANATQSMAPTFTLSISPSQNIIQGKTAVTVSISGSTGKLGASVSSRSINVGGQTSNENSLTLTPKTSGAISVSATVKDSRGLLTTKTATFNVTSYSPPAIDPIQAVRVNGSGQVDDEGTKARVKVTWIVGKLAGADTNTTCTLKYRELGTSTYTDCGTVESEEYVLDGPFDTELGYEFVATASDYISSVSGYGYLDKAYFTLDFKKGGHGMAIGQACTEPGLTINMPTKFRQSLSFEAPAKKSLLDLFYPVGAIYLSFSSTNPETLFGGTWQQLTGRFLRMANDTGTGGNDTMSASMLPAHSHGLNDHKHHFKWTGSHTHTPYRNDVGNNAQGRARYYKTDASAGTKWGMVTNDSSGGVGNLMISSTSITVEGDTGGNSGQTTNAGSGGNGNNMPAYQNVYAWRRTA